MVSQSFTRLRVEIGLRLLAGQFVFLHVFGGLLLDKVGQFGKAPARPQNRR